MAKVGAQRAAELTGKSKSTIQRAMNNGKLSYEVDVNGRRLIDVSELDRVYGLKQKKNETASSEPIERELEKATQMIEMERMKMRIKMLETQLDTANETIDDLRGQRDQWQKQAQQVLITSEYSQKQAEDLKSELKAREEQARKRREQREQQMLAEKMRRMKAENENKKAEQERKAQTVQNPLNSLDIQGLWHKIRGEKPDEKSNEKAA